jgi:hypothetical protein
MHQIQSTNTKFIGAGEQGNKMSVKSALRWARNSNSFRYFLILLIFIYLCYLGVAGQNYWWESMDLVFAVIFLLPPNSSDTLLFPSEWFKRTGTTKESDKST